MGEVEAHESKLYSELAPVYDKTFGKFFSSRVRRIIASLKLPAGAKVLELGVGTGAALAAYPRHCQVIGIDVAPDMLARAREKIAQHGWSHVQVMQMDAMNLRFPDGYFDYVMAFHVVSVVPDPRRMMSEARRVCKADGRIIVVNHFTTDLPVLGFLTRALDPVTRRLGWRTNLKLKPFIGDMDLEVETLYKTSKFSLYTVVVGRNHTNGRAN
jgi:phosphatidylethanolamine/phosphatidyl-N-methylethanolamine N-methyltransferase